MIASSSSSGVGGRDLPARRGALAAKIDNRPIARQKEPCDEARKRAAANTQLRPPLKLRWKSHVQPAGPEQDRDEPMERGPSNRGALRRRSAFPGFIAAGNVLFRTHRARRVCVIEEVIRATRVSQVHRNKTFREMPMDQPTPVDRRKFLGALGVTVGGTGLAGAGLIAGPQLVKAAAEPPKGKIPDTPFRTGHMTFFTSPAAVLGEPSHKGHILAAEELNAQGGLLGKRKN